MRSKRLLKCTQALCVYTAVAIPPLYAVLLFQRRDVLHDAGADKIVAEPIAGLWEPCRPGRLYFLHEVVECARRIILTGVSSFVFNDAAQIATTMLITFFFLTIFELLSPHKSEPDMWLSRGDPVIVVFLSIFFLLTVKMNVADERNLNQAAFAGMMVESHVMMVWPSLSRWCLVLLRGLFLCPKSVKTTQILREFDECDDDACMQAVPLVGSCRCFCCKCLLAIGFVVPR